MKELLGWLKTCHYIHYISIFWLVLLIGLVSMVWGYQSLTTWPKLLFAAFFTAGVMLFLWSGIMKDLRSFKQVFVKNK